MIFIKFPNLSGNSTSRGYENWVTASDIDFDTKRDIETHVGRPIDRMHSIPSFSEVTIYKNVDRASNGLFQNLCNNTVMDLVEIHVCKTDQALSPYLKYKLYNVGVTKHRQIITGGGIPLEELKLNYAKIEIGYTHHDQRGAAGAPMITGFDLEKAEVS